MTVPSLADMTVPCDVEPGEEILKVRKQPNKGLSKFRRGFPVRLTKDQTLMLHMTYMWMQKHGETDQALDELMQTLPAYSEVGAAHGNWVIYKDRRRPKTLRVRGPEVPTLIKLLERAMGLPFNCSYTLKSRAEDLKKLTEMDLMVDAQRE